MVCLVTGGNGLAGSYIVRQLLNNGCTVRVLRRPESDLSQIQDIAGHVEWAEGDILDIFSLEKAIEGCDFVVHAAGLVSFHKKDNNRLFKVNVEGTANVVNVCLNKHIDKLCHISSTAAIGRSKESTHLLDEDEKWDNDEPRTPYASSKHLAEQEVWRGIEEGLSAVIVNPSVIVGAGNWQRSSLKIFDRIYRSPFYFYPPGTINYVDVRDVSEVVYHLLLSNITSARFILNAGSIRYEQFFSEIAFRFGHAPPQKPLQPWLANLACRMESLRAFMIGKKPSLTRSAIQSSFSTWEYDNRKISEALQYSFISLKKSLDDSCDAYLNQKTVLPFESFVKE